MWKPKLAEPFWVDLLIQLLSSNGPKTSLPNCSLSKKPLPQMGSKTTTEEFQCRKTLLVDLQNKFFLKFGLRKNTPFS